MNRLVVRPFGQSDQLADLEKRAKGAADQARYLRCYLADSGCATIVEEPVYFDRDYLAEFSAFYSASARGYDNHCRRLHFFAGPPLKRYTIRRAAGGNPGTLKRLQDDYLGFAVLRPIAVAPFGRTVLRWYPERFPATPRRVVSRSYICHLAGIELQVQGLAWQQQDSGVGACATVAVWSALQSSAFDQHHTIPTTAAVTLAAEAAGARVFPSPGLTDPQICEAAKSFGLSPIVIHGNGTVDEDRPAFTRAFFATHCASLLRSGYPVLLVGELEGIGGHAICAVGFRETGAPNAAPNEVAIHDAQTQYFYVHDDNMGPNIRFEIVDLPQSLDDQKVGKPPVIALSTSAPPRLYFGTPYPDPAATYNRFIPEALICPIHEEVRVSPEPFLQHALLAARKFQGRLHSPPGLGVSTHFTRLAQYMDEGLQGVHPAPSEVLGKTRLALLEQVPPMSLRIGVARISVGRMPLFDLVIDTTEPDRQLRVFCTVAYHPQIASLLTAMAPNLGFDFGEIVPSFP